MSNGNQNWIANFIWSIADDVLRDVFVRGKRRDVILPMTVSSGVCSIEAQSSSASDP